MKFWEATFDAAGTATGLRLLTHVYMTMPRQKGSAQGFSIEMDCESYLVLATAQPHAATYLEQQSFDAGDLSAAATLGQGGQADVVPGYIPPRRGDWVIP